MPPRKKQGAVPGSNSGYGAERVSEEFFGDPQQMPEWAKPEPGDAEATHEPDMDDGRDESRRRGASRPAASGEELSTSAEEPPADAPPPTLDDLRASMQQIMEAEPTEAKPERKRTAKRRKKTGPDAAEPEELDDAQWREKARAILLRQLTASDKSAKQLTDKLLEKGCPEPIAQEVIERFIKVDLVDDEKFANAWVKARTRTRGLARGALKHELRTKGIAEEIAQVALEQVDDQDEEERARELVRVKLRPESMGVDRDRALRRLVGMLGRKGYNGSMAFRVAREEWEARFGEHR